MTLTRDDVSGPQVLVIDGPETDKAEGDVASIRSIIYYSPQEDSLVTRFDILVNGLQHGRQLFGGGIGGNEGRLMGDPRIALVVPSKGVADGVTGLYHRPTLIAILRDLAEKLERAGP